MPLVDAINSVKTTTIRLSWNNINPLTFEDTNIIDVVIGVAYLVQGTMRLTSGAPQRMSIVPAEGHSSAPLHYDDV